MIEGCFAMAVGFCALICLMDVIKLDCSYLACIVLALNADVFGKSTTDRDVLQLEPGWVNGTLSNWICSEGWELTCIDQVAIRSFNDFA